ncbi:DUF6541 family protein [Arthrobacter sp. LAPM80]|uniref:DUF6541 family protein n=1 Tax=Arthrobacter sp. LAPM80 TaxID=3141788 RepID=UPI00398B0563
MTWLETVPTFLVAAVVIFVPGAILARAFGVRGLTWAAAAAPLSVSLAVVGPIAAAAVHVRWNPLVLAGLTLSVSVLAWCVRYFMLTRRRKKTTAKWGSSSTAILAAALGGMAFGGAVISVRFVRMFGSPENISQTYDNVYHLSAVRAILDSGNGSSLVVGSMVQNGPSGTYPFAWHNLVALTAQITSVPIPVAVNAVNVVIGALVWTISAMYLATRVGGTRPAILLMTGIMAGSFGAFPYLAVDWGVLYPNFLAIALLPAFVGMVADILNISVPPRPSRLLSAVILAVGIPGLALAHPNIPMALAAFAVPMVLFWLIRCFTMARRGKLPAGRLGLAVLGVLAYLVLFVLAWDRIRPSLWGSSWPPTLTISTALREALATAPLLITFSLPIFILTLLGVVAVCFRRNQLWLLGIYAVAIMFFVVVSSFPVGPLRQAITGVFFNDSYRLGMMLPVVVLPLVVIGIVWIYDLVMAWIPPSVLALKPIAAALMAVAVVAGVLIGVSAQNDQLRNIQAKTTSDYAMSAESMLLSPDELALLQRAVDIVPNDATVIAQPATGASLFYALEGRRVILPAISSFQSPEVRILLDHFTELGENPGICDAIRKLDAFYLFDFGSRQVSLLGMPFPSSDDLAKMPGLTLLDQVGPSKLYKIDGCL